MKNRHLSAQFSIINLFAIIGLVTGLIVWPGLTESGKSSAVAPPNPPNPTFTETGKFLQPIADAGAAFGWATAMSADTMIVGAPSDDNANGVDAGSVYIFLKDGNGNWTEQANLIASDGAGVISFGHSVAIDGDTMIAGAHHDNAQTGAAYIFTRDGSGVWTEQAKLVASAAVPGDRIGMEAQVNGDTAVISSQYADGSQRGAAYVFVRNGAVWTEEAKIISSDRAPSDRFGAFTSIQGDTLVVSGHTDNDNGAESGSAYIFERSAGIWTETQKLLASDGVIWAQFGTAPVLDGDTIVIGANADTNSNGQFAGAAYVFENISGVWTETAKLLSSDGLPSERLGMRIAFEGDTALVNALGDADNGAWSGSIFVFQRDGAGVWTETQKLLASDGAADDWFGFAPAISGNTAIFGAPSEDNENGSNAGSVYIFGPPTFTVTKTADTNDGVCDADCSLREAIAAANAASTDDTVNFSPLFDTSQTISLGGTVLTVNNSGKTTIDGPGADLLTISGNNASRVFYVNNGAEVEISGVTISDGLAPPVLGGGGILNDGGVVTINNSTIRNNMAVQGGAGIWNGDAFFNLYVGTITINNSTISDNVSDTPTGGGSGGGLRNNLGTATLNNSTLSGNSGVNGGGIFSDGGGILNLVGSTIVNNSPTGNIGGVWNYGGSLVISNTIIANNTSGDCAGSATTNYSLIENGSCLSGSGNLSGDPNLGPLQDNGGSTFTHLLLGGSPAIDAGSNALIPSGSTNDQRGAGFPRIVNSTVDIGAVELGTAPTVDQTIAFGGLAPMTYGDGTFDVSASASSGLTVSFAAAGNCTVVGTTVTILEAGSCTITASQAGDVTYNAAPDVDQGFTIHKAILEVNPDNQQIPVGSPDPSFTFSYSGFVHGEDSSFIDIAPICEVSGAHSDAGSYAITCSGGSDGNYSFNYGTATLSVLYNFVGFFSPVDNLPEINTAKAGQSIPFKWQVPDGQGGFIGDLGIVTALQYTVVACPNQGSIPENPVEADASGNSGLSYDAGAQRYKFVWKTPKSLAGQCADFYVGLSDGSLHRASFAFK